MEDSLAIEGTPIAARRTRMRFAVHATLLLSSLAACSTTPTQLVVVVDSDLIVPSELSAVRVITSRNDVTVTELDFPVGLELGQATQVLPFSFGVVPSSGDDITERVRITVQGLDRLGDVVVEQTALVGFLPGQSLLLPFFLARSCRSIVCGTGLTCTREGCVSEWIAAGGLLVIIPGTELSSDATVSRADAAVIDARDTDGGSFDATAEADVLSSDAPSDSRPDAPGAGCTECAAMGWGCDSTCPDGARCECGGGCACDILCGDGDDCITECGSASMCQLDVRRASNADIYCDGMATCMVDGRNAANVDMFCSESATCILDCAGVSNCYVACTGSAGCEVDCSGTSNCTFTDCHGAEAWCAGDVITCNRACP